MNVQITDYSSNGFINRTERYDNGTTVQVRGNEWNNGYFNAQVTTQRSDGYCLVEQISGTVYNDGVSNLQRQTISEQLPYAPMQFNTVNCGAVRRERTHGFER